MEILQELQSLSSGSTGRWAPMTEDLARAFSPEGELVTLAVAGVALLVFAFTTISNYLFFSDVERLLEKSKNALKTSEIEKLAERVEQLQPRTAVEAPWSEWTTDCTCEQPFYLRTRNGTEEQTRSCRPTDMTDRIRQTAGLPCSDTGKAMPYIVGKSRLTEVLDFSGFGYDCTRLNYQAGEVFVTVLDGVGYLFGNRFFQNKAAKLDPKEMPNFEAIPNLVNDAKLTTLMDAHPTTRISVVTPAGKFWALKGDPTLEFDPLTESFSEGPALPLDESSDRPEPKELEYHCVVKYDDDNVLMMGGRNRGGGNPHTDEVWNYRFSSGEWTKYPSLPLKIANGACGRVTTSIGQEKILLIGGIVRQDGVVRVTRRVHIFDIATKTWSFGRPFPIGLKEMAGIEYGRTMLVMGGDNIEDQGQHEVYQYDPDRDEWFLRPEILPEYDEDVMAELFLEAAPLCQDPEPLDYEDALQLINVY